MVGVCPPRCPPSAATASSRRPSSRGCWRASGPPSTRWEATSCCTTPRWPSQLVQELRNAPGGEVVVPRPPRLDRDAGHLLVHRPDVRLELAVLVGREALGR